jgi:hypothetical protein
MDTSPCARQAAEYFLTRRIKMSKRIVAMAFASGLLGGVISHYLWPLPVLAETSPAEIRARKFVLVNDGGIVLGTFAEEANGPALKLFDTNGREIWVAGKSTPDYSANRSFAIAGK